MKISFHSLEVNVRCTVHDPMHVASRIIRYGHNSFMPPYIFCSVCILFFFVSFLFLTGTFKFAFSFSFSSNMYWDAEWISFPWNAVNNDNIYDCIALEATVNIIISLNRLDKSVEALKWVAENGLPTIKRNKTSPANNNNDSYYHEFKGTANQWTCHALISRWSVIHCVVGDLVFDIVEGA